MKYIKIRLLFLITNFIGTLSAQTVPIDMGTVWADSIYHDFSNNTSDSASLDSLFWDNVKKQFRIHMDKWERCYSLASAALAHRLYTFSKTECDSIWQGEQIQHIALELHDDSVRYVVEQKALRKIKGYTPIVPKDTTKRDFREIIRFMDECEQLAKYAIQYRWFEIDRDTKKSLIRFAQEKILQEKLMQDSLLRKEYEEKLSLYIIEE